MWLNTHTHVSFANEKITHCQLYVCGVALEPDFSIYPFSIPTFFFYSCLTLKCVGGYLPSQEKDLPQVPLDFFFFFSVCVKGNLDQLVESTLASPLDVMEVMRPYPHIKERYHFTCYCTNCLYFFIFLNTYVVSLAFLSFHLDCGFLFLISVVCLCVRKKLPRCHVQVYPAVISTPPAKLCRPLLSTLVSLSFCYPTKQKHKYHTPTYYCIRVCSSSHVVSDLETIIKSTRIRYGYIRNGIYRKKGCC